MRLDLLSPLPPHSTYNVKRVNPQLLRDLQHSYSDGRREQHTTSSFQRYTLNLQTKRITEPCTFVQNMFVKNQVIYSNAKASPPSAGESSGNTGRRLCGWDSDIKGMPFYNPI